MRLVRPIFPWLPVSLRWSWELRLFSLGLATVSGRGLPTVVVLSAVRFPRAEFQSLPDSSARTFPHLFSLRPFSTGEGRRPANPGGQRKRIFRRWTSPPASVLHQHDPGARCARPVVSCIGTPAVGQSVSDWTGRNGPGDFERVSEGGF